MVFITHLFIGIFSGFTGLIPPGMLNMTTVRNSLVYGRGSGLKFALGASIVVIAQAALALSFASFFKSRPDILDQLSVAAIAIFLLLSVYFFWLARKTQHFNPKATKKNFIISGMLMSLINMLAIPYYLGLSTYWNAKSYLILEQPYIALFVIGCSLGAFALFTVYAYFAEVIERRASFIAKNINYILSLLFVVLAILAFFR